MTASMDLGPVFTTRLAIDPGDQRAAQRLRYSVFVEELGADGDLVDHSNRLEIDRFDAFSEQLVVLDESRPEADQVVGVYRLMDRQGAQAAGRFYSDDEFDLSPLMASGRPLMELGRTCLHPDYRGGAAMMHLWQALAREVQARGVEVLFGMASFHGTDLDALADPIGLLMDDHSAPDGLRPKSRQDHTFESPLEVDRIAALRQVPALIKAYLRLGGGVGEGVFVDAAFNTTDVCLVLDVNSMNARQRAIYGGAR